MSDFSSSGTFYMVLGKDSGMLKKLNQEMKSTREIKCFWQMHSYQIVSYL